MCKWHPTSEHPESNGCFVDVWLHLLGNEIIRGLFIKNPDEPIAADAPMWFDEEQYLLNPAMVLSWSPRRQNDQPPEPPLHFAPVTHN